MVTAGFAFFAGLALTGADPIVGSDSKPVVAVLPPRAFSGDDEALADVIQDRATELLDLTGHYSLLHLKQIRRMAEWEGISAAEIDQPAKAWQAGHHLGADRLVASTLIRSRDGWSLSLAGSAAPGHFSESQTVRLPSDWSQAVSKGGEALAEAVGAQDHVALPPVADLTHSDSAMQDYAACFQVLIRQPMGLDNPNILLKDDLDAAVVRCRNAVATDPNFAEARAALALALAIQGDSSEAASDLKGLSQARTYLPLAWVSWFWLRTRNESSAAGTEALHKAIARDPGLLLFRSYLAEHLTTLHEEKEALQAWDSYLAIAPKSPLGMARRGYVMARLGDKAGAMSATQAALAMDPESRVAKLELAGRAVDAGDLPKAKAILNELVSTGKASAEAYLRLGYVELRTGDLDSSKEHLQQALTRAGEAAEWRTRARAHIDLARVADAQGQHEEALSQVSAAMREGYRVSSLHADDALIVKLSREASARPMIDLRAAPPEVSPFPIDSSGELQPVPGRELPPPQAGIRILDF